MSKYSKRTLEIRKLTGMPQWEMASMLHTSREALANYETKNRHSLQGTAHLYHVSLYAEMLKPENREAVAHDTVSDAGKEKLRKMLETIARDNHYKASALLREIDKCIELQEQAYNRKLLLQVAPMVQASLRDASKDLPVSFISDRQQKWVEDRKASGYFAGYDDELFISQKLLELKYKRLIAEAEAAEKMIAEL